MSEAPVLVELVDGRGKTIATSEKLAAHRPPGVWHRAFSVFLFSDDGRMLLQRRALGKYHSPGVWSNSCCGHPLPGEAPILAAARRTVEELGAEPLALTEAGTVTYDLPDPDSGLVEKEYNHLFIGRIGDELRPDPEEVAETVLVTAEELGHRRAADPFSVWFGTVLDAAASRLRDTVPDSGW
jgi:isopentenyl-diphosphate Delta-isomerase